MNVLKNNYMIKRKQKIKNHFCKCKVIYILTTSIFKLWKNNFEKQFWIFEIVKLKIWTKYKNL